VSAENLRRKEQGIRTAKEHSSGVAGKNGQRRRLVTRPPAGEVSMVEKKENPGKVKTYLSWGKKGLDCSCKKTHREP